MKNLMKILFFNYLILIEIYFFKNIRIYLLLILIEILLFIMFFKEK